MDECKHGLPQFLCLLGCNGNEKTAGDSGGSPSGTVHGMATSPPRRTRLERAAHMTAALPSIAKIAELLGGDVQGAEVLCPGPGHSAGDRSLSVKPDPADREGFVTHSFAGDDWKDCRDHVRTKLGLPEPKSEPKKKTNGGKAAWTVLAEYIYRDQNGERLSEGPKVPGCDRQKAIPAVSLGRTAAGPRASLMARRFRIACRS